MANLGIPSNTIEVLQKYNFNFQKKFGQNFLIDTHVLEKIIDASEIKPGMIRLGFPVVRAYPNNGLSFSNEGTITFRGYCTIGGGNSGLVTLKTGHIIFGNDFNSTAGGVIVCAKRIEMGNFVQLGWGTKIIDTNFHPLYDLTQEKCKKVHFFSRAGALCQLFQERSQLF